MYETWLKRARPGLPRMAVWMLAWLLTPLILLVVIPLELVLHGIAEARALLDEVNRELHWLWRQRTTFNLDPWEQAR